MAYFMFSDCACTDRWEPLKYQDSRYPSQVLNPGRLKYDSGCSSCNTDAVQGCCFDGISAVHV